MESGVTFIVDGASPLGSIDVSSDRLVIWTRSQHEPDLSGQTPQDERVPLEIYMEGNVVFRQGELEVHATRMYYDVTNRVGTILDADLLTPVRKYQGLLRLHAEIMQQVGEGRYVAQNGYFTGSRMGVPTYRLQSGDITFEDIQHTEIDPLTGQAKINPDTNEPAIEHERLATARNDLVYFEDVPVFYWPFIATDLNEPSYFIRRVQYKDDSVFGEQFLVDFNMYQLLGVQKPPKGTDWDLSLDYMSLRGFGYGSTYQYQAENLFGIPGHSAGLVDYWGIHDTGYDNLGQDRSHLLPETEDRYRFILQDRQELPGGYQVTIEGGVQSDNNFLQEFFRHEWDELKDQTTDVELKQICGNISWNVFASLRTDDFVTQTSWLPRADHFWLGQSLLGDNLTWFEHSSAGYADYKIADAPTNPADSPFSHMPWEQFDRQGARLLSRQEIDFPMQLGFVKVVPYALGELGYWGEDINGDSLSRVYGMAGVRADLPMWTVDPTVESTLWNVHGIAHKVDFQVELLASETNQPLTALPLYDPLNDWSVEAFERRFVTLTYGIGPIPPPGAAPLPAQVDERFYALRYGMGGWVTGPSMEIAGDLEEIRLGIHQRWQTKRGPPDNYHILDWITLDTDVIFYPDPNRDNFGQVAGMLDYAFRWHVGDRLTLVSDGNFDFFDYGEKEVTVGAFLNRPPRGTWYLGARFLEGPISEDVITIAYNYLMSPKWMSSYSMSFDINDTSNIAANLRITRIGESMLVSAGILYDPVYNTWGANISIEPRFMPKGQLGMIGSTRVPAAGATGLE
jgi:hypothetical protein